MPKNAGLYKNCLSNQGGGSEDTGEDIDSRIRKAMSSFMKLK